MRQLMKIRWPVLLTGQGLLSFAMTNSAFSWFQGVSNHHTAIEVAVVGTLGLAIITVVAIFALKGMPFLADNTLNPVYDNSIMPINSPFSERPMTFIVSLFLIPLYSVPMMITTLDVDPNVGSFYSCLHGAMPGIIVLISAYAVDYLYRTLTGRRNPKQQPVPSS